MRRIVGVVIFLSAAATSYAQTRALDGTVKSASGQPVAGMNVAVTLLPIDDAEDVTATAVTDEAGRFHFENLPGGKYGVAAASSTACGGATTADLTNDSSPAISIIASAACRTISGHVSGPAGVHVIAGHFHEGQVDLYAILVRDGRYTIVVPSGGMVVVQALAPRFASIETPVTGRGDASIDLVAERRFPAMPPAARQWVAANAIALKAVTAGNGFEDMNRLRGVVGDARIVALGEATHGTREFFLFKHRMLEFLVSKMGFNLFAIEASEPDSMAVDDYVLTGKGDPAVALRNLGFWTWNTEEVLDMIRWMRAWNEDPRHERKVRFYGFDMQNPSAAQRRLKVWLTASLPSALPLLERTGPLGRMQSGKRLTPEEKKDVAKAVGELGSLVDGVVPHDAGWQTARHLVELLAEAIPLADDPSSRDRAMAENIRWILDHEAPQSRMVVWAHNGHVSAEPLPFAPGGTMGVHLRTAFGKRLLVVGFVFNRGSFQAFDRKKGLIEQKAEPLDESAFDRGLASSGPPIFVLDLRGATGAAREWLQAALPMRSIGAVYNEATPKSFVSRIHPSRSFDAIFFVNETTAAREVRIPMSKPLATPVNLSLDEGLTGWALGPQSADAGYVIRAATDGCVRGGCAVMTRTAERKSDGSGSFTQRIDATSFRGKRIRFRAKIKSSLVGDGSSARIWLRVDRGAKGMGFFDNMENRAPGSLPEWTEFEIVGEVAADAEVISFGELMLGDGTAWFDEATLEIVP
jgi:erythromycin esterase